MKKIKLIHKKREWNGLLFILPSLLGVMIFILVPFLDVLRRSFLSAIPGVFVGVENFKNVFGNVAFRLAAWNTMRFTVICIPLLVILSLSVALSLQKRAKSAHLFKSGFLVPMAIPVASIVLMWRVLFHEHGLLNGVLERIGMETIDWMNTGYAFWILVFSYVWKNLGYNIALWMAGLSQISTSIYEAAEVDGAGEWKCFFFITLPNILPILFTITIISLLNSFKVFREAYLVAGDYPHESMYMLQHLFNNWFRDMSFDKLASGAVLNSIILFGLIIILQKSWGAKE